MNERILNSFSRPKVAERLLSNCEALVARAAQLAQPTPSLTLNCRLCSQLPDIPTSLSRPGNDPILWPVHHGRNARVTSGGNIPVSIDSDHEQA